MKVQKYKLFDFVILIPIYNDGDKIKSLRKELNKYLSHFSFFVCFVDDSEDDNTSLEIKNNFNNNFKILRRIKKEKYSTRFSASIFGFEWIVNNVKSKYIVEIDSDLAHHPKDIAKGIELLKRGDCDMVIGSKYHKNSIVKNRDLFRRFISKFITLLCMLIFNKKISDYTNTFRFYNYELVRKFIREDVKFKSPIGHLNNLLFILKNNYVIKEISTEYIDNNSESTVKMVSMLRYLFELLHCILFNKFLRS